MTHLKKLSQIELYSAFFLTVSDYHQGQPLFQIVSVWEFGQAIWQVSLTHLQQRKFSLADLKFPVASPRIS